MEVQKETGENFTEHDEMQAKLRLQEDGEAEQKKMGGLPEASRANNYLTVKMIRNIIPWTVKVMTKYYLTVKMIRNIIPGTVKIMNTDYSSESFKKQELKGRNPMIYEGIVDVSVIEVVEKNNVMLVAKTNVKLPLHDRLRTIFDKGRSNELQSIFFSIKLIVCILQGSLLRGIVLKFIL